MGSSHFLLSLCLSLVCLQPATLSHPSHTPEGSHPCTATPLPPHAHPAFTLQSPTPAVKVHRNFKEALTIKVPFAAEAIYGGALLGVRASDFIVFYDWATGKVGVVLVLWWR